MKKRKVLAVLLCAAMTAALAVGCGGSKGSDSSDKSSDSSSSSDDVITVGFSQVGAESDWRTANSQSMKDTFSKENGYDLIFDDAQQKQENQITAIRNFIQQEVDYILLAPVTETGWDTVLQEAKDADIPVIYTAVTDPVLAELANADGTPVGEITGTSDKLPVESQLKMIRTMLPDAKTIGIMYSTSEINSVSAIEEYKEAAPEYGFEIVESGISSTADIPLAADALVEKVDCINNLTDNTVVSSLPVILDKAAKKNIPVFGSEIEQVKIGCLAAVGLDYVSLGEQTGKMAAKVLKGEKKASEMNFEIIEEAAFYGNNKVAENLGITIPAELSDNAAALFDEIITN